VVGDVAARYSADRRRRGSVVDGRQGGAVPAVRQSVSAATEVPSPSRLQSDAYVAMATRT